MVYFPEQSEARALVDRRPQGLAGALAGLVRAALISEEVALTAATRQTVCSGLTDIPS